MANRKTAIFIIGFGIIELGVFILASNFVSTLKSDVVGPLILGLPGGNQLSFQIFTFVQILLVPAGFQVWKLISNKNLDGPAAWMKIVSPRPEGTSSENPIWKYVFTSISALFFLTNGLYATAIGTKSLVFTSVFLLMSLVVLLLSWIAIKKTLRVAQKRDFVLSLLFAGFTSLTLAIKFYGDSTGLTRTYLIVGVFWLFLIGFTMIFRFMWPFSRVIQDSFVFIPGISFLALSRSSQNDGLHSFESYWYANLQTLNSGGLPWLDFDAEHGIWEDLYRFVLSQEVGGQSLWGIYEGYRGFVFPLELSVLFLAIYLLRRNLGDSSLIFFAGYFIASIFRIDLNGMPRMLPLLILTVLFFYFIQKTTTPKSVVLGLFMSVSLIWSNEALYSILIVFLFLVMAALKRTMLPKINWRQFFVIFGSFVVGIFIILFPFNLIGAWLNKFSSYGSGYFLAWGANFDFSLGPSYWLLILLVPLSAIFYLTYVLDIYIKGEVGALGSKLFLLPLIGTIFAYYIKFIQWPDWHLAQSATLLFWGVMLAAVFLKPSQDRKFSMQGINWGAASLLLISMFTNQIVAIPNNFAISRSEKRAGEIGLTDSGTDSYINTVIEAQAKFSPYISKGISQKLYDFGNEPVSWYGVAGFTPVQNTNKALSLFSLESQAFTVEALQEQAISSVIWGSQFGYWSWPFNGTWMKQYLVSQYILENFDPVSQSNGYVLMQRKGLNPVNADALANVKSLSCNWHDGARRFLNPDRVDPTLATDWVSLTGGSLVSKEMLLESPLAPSKGLIARSEMGATVKLRTSSSGEIEFQIPAGNEPLVIWLPGCPAWALSDARESFSVSSDGNFSVAVK